MEERLQKLLSAAGLCSRRQAEEYLRAGRVAVNGEVCTMRGKKLRPGDRAVIDDETELVVQ